MKPTKHQTSSHFIATLLIQAQKIGLDVEAIRSSLRLPETLTFESEKWINNSYLSTLMKMIWNESKDEGMGYFLEIMKPGTGALIFKYMIGAKNLSELFKRGAHITSYIPPEKFGYKFIIDEHKAILDLTYNQAANDVDHFMNEFLMLVWHRFASWAIDQHIPLQQANFMYDRPTHGWFYKSLFHCEILFNQPNTQFMFPASYLSKPITRSQNELESWLENSPTDLLYLSRNDPSIQTRIKLCIHNELDTKNYIPSFDVICEQLGMTPQMVRRRLNSEGKSYQKIKDSTRQDKAVEYLRNSKIRISEIAIKTGFSEPASFSRAFRKWKGRSPAEFRELFTGLNQSTNKN